MSTPQPTRFDEDGAELRLSLSRDQSGYTAKQVAKKRREDLQKQVAGVCLVGLGLALTMSGVVALLNGPFFPFSYTPDEASANFLYDSRAMLTIIAGLLVINIRSMVN